MQELAFPFLAIAASFGLLIPGLTVGARQVLRWRRARTSSWSDFGDDLTFLILVSPTLIPLTWLLSALAHHSGAQNATEVCLVSHDVALCGDTLVLVLAVVGMMAAALLFAWRQFKSESRGAVLPRAHHAYGVIEGLKARHPELSRVRILPVEMGPSPAYTDGLVRPTVYVDACFLEASDPELVHAALLHEVCHARGADVARFFVLRFCNYLNPLARLLDGEVEHWRSAREADCDAYAVYMGGDRLALAQSLVRGARFRCAHVAGLCGHSRQALKLRVSLLMGDHELVPRQSRSYLFVVFLFVAMFGHLDGGKLMNWFHSGVEGLLVHMF